MRILALITLAALGLAGCLGDQDLQGQTDSGTEVLQDVAHEIPDMVAVLECSEDAECDDGEPCTRDTCDLESWSCAHEAVTGPSWAGVDVQLTHTSTYSGSPSLVWTGSALGAAWADGRLDGCTEFSGPEPCNIEVFLTLLDPEGVSMMEPRRITDHELPCGPREIMWTGAGFAILSKCTADLSLHSDALLSQVDPMGTPISDQIPLNGDDGIINTTFRAVWTGSEVAVSWKKPAVPEWSPFAGMSLLTRFSLAGDREDIAFDHGRVPELTWTGSLLGMAWNQGRTTGP